MKEFFDHLDRITAALQDPEYLFLVLEPLQLWGIAFGLLGLAITWFLKSEKLQVASLIVVVVSVHSFKLSCSAVDRIRPPPVTVNPAAVTRSTIDTRDLINSTSAPIDHRPCCHLQRRLHQMAPQKDRAADDQYLHCLAPSMRQ